jgi:D-alanyl-D-alanine carboxypeptidase
MPMAKSGAKGDRKAGGVKIKKVNVFAGMLSIVVVLSLANSAYHDFNRKPTGESVINRGTFADSNSTDPPTGTGTTNSEGMGNGDPENNGITTINESDQSIDEVIISERIALIDEDNPGTSTNKHKSAAVEKEKNEFYKVVEGGVRLNSDALEAFNAMMKDYGNETGLTDFIIYGTTSTYTDSGSCCPESFPESVTGDCVDVALSSWGNIIAFDGQDTEKWIIDNCWKYGYILRYPENGSSDHGFCPWHFRYVGTLHSAIMHTNGDMCLEDYVDYLTGYTASQPLDFSIGGKDYEVYTSAKSTDSSCVRVPLKGNYDVFDTFTGNYVIALEK